MKIQYHVKTLEMPQFLKLWISDFIPTIFLPENNNSGVCQVVIETYCNNDLQQFYDVFLNEDETCLYLAGNITWNDRPRDLVLNMSYCFSIFQASGQTELIILGDEIYRTGKQITYKPCIRETHIDTSY